MSKNNIKSASTVMFFLLVVIINVVGATSTWDSLPMGTLEKQQEFFNQCRIDCLSKGISGNTIDSLAGEMCKMECTKIRNSVLKDECAALQISGSIAVCTSSNCVFAPRSMFPYDLDSFDSRHYLNLVAYCTKAGMDVFIAIPDFESECSITAQILDTIEGSRQKAFEMLVDKLPESSPAIVNQPIHVDLIKSHPDVKIMFKSVARIYLELADRFETVNQLVVQAVRSKDYSTDVIVNQFDLSTDIPEYDDPEFVWYSPGDSKVGVNADDSPKQDSTILSDAILGIVTFFGKSSFAPIFRKDAPEPKKVIPECSVSLYDNRDGTMSWILGRGDTRETFGYQLKLQESFPVVPPTLIYSRRHLEDLCHNINVQTPTGAISANVDPYLYQFGLTDFPVYMKSVKISNPLGTVIRMDF